MIAPQKKHQNKTSSFRKRLLTYSAAAGMTLAVGAGASANAASEPVMEVDPAHMVSNDDFNISLVRTFHAPTAQGTIDIQNTYYNSAFYLDFDDGGADPEFKIVHTYGSAIYLYPDLVGADTGKYFVGYVTAGNKKYASALNAGTNINTTRAFQDLTTGTINRRYANMAYSTSFPWAGATNLYLGLQFSLNGTPHYGWLRLTVPGDSSNLFVDKGAYHLTSITTGSGPTAVTLQDLSADNTTNAGVIGLIASGLAAIGGLFMALRHRFSRR
ncbi:MAG: hypothetical protein GY796_26020 [Chloroflexi bacterium]|nr:hypothetical protein [Chloroflexota bacterium]